MNTKTELENQLVNEIHRLPIEAIETLLKLTALMNKSNVNIKNHQQPNNFYDFIRNSPLMDVDIDLTRNQSVCRDIEL